MRNISSLCNKIQNGIYAVQKFILLIFVSIEILVNIIGVFGRYLFHFSIPWSSDLSVLLFVFIIFLGGSISMKTDSEIKIDILKLKNACAQGVLNIIRDVIALIALIVLFISGIFLIQNSIRFPQYIASLYMKYSVAFVVMEVGFGLMIIEKCAHLYCCFSQLNSKGGELK